MTDTDAPDEPQLENPEGRREKHRVSGDSVVGKIKELIREGNVRHVVIKNGEGRTLIEFPVSIGLAGALLLPVWAAVGAVAAMVTDCTIEVERNEEEEEEAAEE